jgi:Protein of unknown function (DUF2846)
MTHLLMVGAKALIGLTILAAPPAMAASAKDTPKMNVILAPPPAGKGQVVFFRPSAMGMAIRCTIRENGKMIGRVGNGKYMVLTAAPGPHKYTTKTEATDELNLEVEPDETTYVKCKIAAGIMAGRPNLSPATKADFDAKSVKMGMQDMAKLAGQIAEDEAELAKSATAK